MGKLTTLGASLSAGSEDKNNIDQTVICFTAQVPDEKIFEFKEWFKMVSQGTEEIDKHT